MRTASQEFDCEARIYTVILWMKQRMKWKKKKKITNDDGKAAAAAYNKNFNQNWTKRGEMLLLEKERIGEKKE